MTNGEMYKTTEERDKAFLGYCWSCVLNKIGEGCTSDAFPDCEKCQSNWLEQEVDEKYEEWRERLEREERSQ